MLAGVRAHLVSLVRGLRRDSGIVLYGEWPFVVTVFVQCSVRALGKYENVNLPAQLVGLSRASGAGMCGEGPRVIISPLQFPGIVATLAQVATCRPQEVVR